MHIVCKKQFYNVSLPTIIMLLGAPLDVAWFISVDIWRWQPPTISLDDIWQVVLQKEKLGEISDTICRQYILLSFI